jgi:hypothetical protein
MIFRVTKFADEIATPRAMGASMTTATRVRG